MNRRKIFGTVIGLIFWSICIMFFTYAYYDWKSNPTNVVLGIEDLSVECFVGAEVNATNIGPVLNYQDGVKAEFSIDNSLIESMAIELYLDITSISDSLLSESLKYVLVADSTGGINYDYNNPILEGDFTNFVVGNNLIIQDLEVTADVTTNYQFIIYIDGNMYNDPNMQENSLTANLMIGNCGGDAVSMNELVYQAIYSETDNSLTFVHRKPLTVGDTYNDKVITAVYTGFETAHYTSSSSVPWYSVRENITTVNFDSIIKPKSTKSWFYEFRNLTDIDLTKLDTSNVTNMSDMFNGCSSLKSLNINNFDTSEVTSMTSMFWACSSLTELDLNSWNTGKVTSMNYMFYKCSNLETLNISNFNTGNVTHMNFMFMYLDKISTLDLSNWDTSKVKDMQYMFCNCDVVSLDLSGFETNNVEKMTSMFYGATDLEELNISGWNIENVTDMSGMFANCIRLERIVGLEELNTSNVTSMGEYKDAGSNLHKGMFYACHKLTGTITISNPNTTYLNIFNQVATNTGTQLTVNYTPETSDLVDAMIASKTSDSNVVKGVCVGDSCPVEDEGTDEGIV